MVKLLNSPFLVWYFTYQTGNPDLVKERKQVFFLRASWGSSRGRFCFCNVPPSPSSGVRELCRHREHCHPLVTQHALWWPAALRLTQGSDRHLLVEQPLPALAHRLLFFFFPLDKKGWSKPSHCCPSIWWNSTTEDDLFFLLWMKVHELKDGEWGIQVKFMSPKQGLQPSRSTLLSGSAYYLRSETGILKTTLIYSEYNPVQQGGNVDQEPFMCLVL